ncbi:MAG: UDP-N-acetylmuramoyl-L-alanine--D-glutamate ligase [Actinomycetota bacterium]
MSGAFAGTRAVVVGLGASGHAAVRALIEEGASVLVSEQRDAEDLDGVAAIGSLGAEVLAGGHEPAHLEGADLVVVSPGVPVGAPVLRWASERGLPVWSELELGARLCAVPVVAITGTNGKTTTTEMVAAAMRAAGLDAVACGNIGYPFCTAAREDHDALAVEASSFQLRFVDTFHPRVSVLLNLSPDHLDWHGSMDAYADAKARMFERQASGDVHVGNADDPLAAAVSGTAPCEQRWFRLGPPASGEVGYEDDELTSALGDPPVRLGRPSGNGRGFMGDAAAAAAAAIAFGLEPRRVGEGIRSVEPLPHRGRVVARAGAVAFVDDSKATNPHAALASLDGLTDVVLIAGGLSKGVDLSVLAAATPNLAAVVVIGEAAAEIAAVFEEAVPVRKAGSMEEAVRLAFDLTPPQGTVLLAPACASQDMFRDYRERGERFTAAAEGIARASGSGEGSG